MFWQIYVRAKHESHDARGRAVLAALRCAGFDDVCSVRATRLYWVQGQLDRVAVERLARDLFADPVIEKWRCDARPDWPASSHVLVDVYLQPGVMDPVAQTATAAVCDLLKMLPDAEDVATVKVRTAWRYEIAGVRTLDRVDAMVRHVLANSCMEMAFVCGLGRCDSLPRHFTMPPDPSPTLERVGDPRPDQPFERRTVRLAGLEDEALADLSRDARLALSADEMRAIRDHFAVLDRDPTDLELETLAQTWSEHCVHKTLTSAVEYKGVPFGQPVDSGEQVTVSYDNLLRDTIFRATKELNKPWCLSVFEDNAGIVAFDGQQAIAFKVETHNHPSAIEPYGGAATGMGGCIRDILGCGLGAKPIAGTDVFCLANPAFDRDRLPQGVLHPQRVLSGVVAGVRDYGNRMGIPTIAGGLHFDDRYLANPLVFCGCVGLIPRDRIAKRPVEGDRIVLVGGRTGRDGLGGATFSSAGLTDKHADTFAHAVQIGNAIEEKKVLDALLQARDHKHGCLYSTITDCGAGGLSSAVGEMAGGTESLGAVVDLEAVPLKYGGLRYNEIWLSEAQERMVLAIPPDRVETLRSLFAEEDVETSVIGKFTGDGVLSVRYNGVEVGRLDVDFLHHGFPKRRRTARWATPPQSDTVTQNDDLADALLARLGSLNVCSREAVFRQYDLEVQGSSIIKPLVGPGEGPSDAAVVRPLWTSDQGVAIGCGLGVQMPDDDPYWMAVRAIDEAIRNVISVGAAPDRIALLDNFCWGGCDDEQEMGALVRACQACYDAAIAYGTPFISGKDSLNNQFFMSADDAKRLSLPQPLSIPATLLISAIGIVRDVHRCVTSDLKHSGHRLIYVSTDIQSNGLAKCAAMHRAVASLLQSGHVAACHDVSDGGLAICIAEMCIGGRRGVTIELNHAQTGSDAKAWLFNESRSGYVLEVEKDTDCHHLEPWADVVELGIVRDDTRFQMVCEEATLVDLGVDRLGVVWRTVRM